ncbi:MAG: aldose 1-epimerase family protein [Bacteroidetes bacterium]|nr:aldose 1-epimerase family protein [Bacteroidota bacterium]
MAGSNSIIENDVLRVEISATGAELQSVFFKPKNLEMLWQGNPAFWPRRAPLLFPNIGELNNGVYRVKGREYELGRHGFLRKSELKVIEKSAAKIGFELRSSNETLEVYPFMFCMEIWYELIGNSLKHQFKLINDDAETMFYQLGGHPAFNICHFAGEELSDYYLEFPVEGLPEMHLLNHNGLFNGKTKKLKLQQGKLPISQSLFNNDALVFKSLNFDTVQLKSHKHDLGIQVDFVGFPQLGIWSKPGAPFVCIEPWLGCADHEGFEGDISERFGVQELGANNETLHEFSVRVLG